jgi:hypothetical protein
MLLGLGNVNVQAQGFSNPPPSNRGFFSQGASAIGGFFSQDLPGAFDSMMPLLFPPYFGGEIHIRPYFYGLTKGEINGKDLGLSGNGVYVENMVRFQFSRLSFRTYWNVYIQGIPENTGYVNWSDWRLGADLDVVNSYGVRLGATFDYYIERPTLKFGQNSVVANRLNLVSNGQIVANPPLTFGIVAAYNPFTSWTVSPSFEFRYDWPFQNNSSKITQWECAIGLKLPKTVLGSTGVRFGYRETEVVFGSGDNTTLRDAKVTLVTAGYFGELVWFY